MSLDAVMVGPSNCKSVAHVDMLTALVVSLLVLQARACTSDADCYGGKCVAAGACVCPPLWSGPLCQTLRLKPTAQLSDLELRQIVASVTRHRLGLSFQ